ncbi:MAG: DUF2891 domain-containing protein [Ignavibacteria bacterium]|nr:DUF2891 domain-containing protein [Ignavibacteria bacterium]
MFSPVLVLLLVTPAGVCQDAGRAVEEKLLLRLRLTPEAASNFARLALNCINKEYPNKPEHVMNDERDLQSPQALHPAFYGCFDWHSSVHGHWMLVRLLRTFPDLPEAAEIRAALHQNLSAQNIRAEVTYLDQPGRKSFERMYGWAWLLKLAEETQAWDDPDARQWSKNLTPLARAICRRYLDFLPRQTYPIRTGVHPNTAFGVAFALDYARAAGNKELEKLLVERALAYYERDEACPASWEPGGEDFFSPCLMEADLMRRVLLPHRFQKWFAQFLPEIDKGTPRALLQSAIVSDRSDPKIVHLDGLNLSRAWCMIGIASSFPEAHPTRRNLVESAVRHAESTLGHIASGHYEGEHWLGSFAIFMLSQAKQLHER